MMTSPSILFQNREDSRKAPSEAPAFFSDLNLDQIVDAITASKAAYDLKPFFYQSLREIDAIEYRHEVMRDLEDKSALERIRAFAKSMGEMREHLEQSEKLYYKDQKQAWFLHTVDIYCGAVERLKQDLHAADLKSRGLVAFREYLASYVEAEQFTSLVNETEKLKADLNGITYCVLIKGGSFKVRKYESETDYSAEVESTFEKFKQGAVKSYLAKITNGVEMNHIEAKVLEFVTRLYPEIFATLDQYCSSRADYLDRAIAVFDREVQFYVAYLEYISQFRAAGLQMCYPSVSASKEVFNSEGFDLALAHKLRNKESPVVCNDFYLKGKERIIVVSGPNQGGKTTFARTFGQLHYLASLGCLVPGREAHLFLFDQLFTHFERQEDISTLRGKLEDDLFRISQILDRATSDSIFIMNEIFTSTTLRDAISLGSKILETIRQLDALCVCVTFIDEWSSLSEKSVSMVSTVVPDNPAVRTFKVIRMPADGRSYAMSLARQYRLTYACIKERVQG
jgi:DNA mismatch repair protein MutS